MNFGLKLTLIALALATVTFGENVGSTAVSEPEGTHRLNTWKDPYRWSVASVSLVTAADLASSLKFSSDGQREANPLLRSANGGYSGKGAAIEAGVVGGSLLLQHFLVAKHPKLKVPFLIGNYALAGFQVFNIKHNLSY